MLLNTPSIRSLKVVSAAARAVASALTADAVAASACVFVYTSASLLATDSSIATELLFTVKTPLASRNVIVLIVTLSTATTFGALTC